MKINTEKSDLLKICYVPSLNIPIIYWRIENYAEELVKLKDDCICHVLYMLDPNENYAWDDACVGKGKLSAQLQDKLRGAFSFFDVLIFQRIQNKAALALIEQLRKEYPDTKIVAEIDDCIGEVALSSMHNWQNEHMWAAEHLHMSDAVICSTPYLGESIRPIIGDKPLHVAPNCIQKMTWKPKTSSKINDKFRLGYVGGGAHDEDLFIAYRAILNLIDDQDAFEFVVRYGGFRPKWLKDHPNIDFKRVSWHISKYPQELADLNIDLALAPLRDSEFNRCKSNIKWIEWSSIGVPMIGSNVEPYKNTNGSIILTDNYVDDFTDTLKNNIGSIDKKKWGLKLRKECLKNYNIKNESKNVLEFIKTLL